MSDENLVKHTRTFKKYKAEYRMDLVNAARAYGAARSDFVLYEDRSIVKLTSTKAAIEAMCNELRAKFGALPGDEAADAKKEKAAK